VLRGRASWAAVRGMNSVRLTRLSSLVVSPR
jgi:hypothetical protein